jgi:hypothetical protein
MDSITATERISKRPVIILLLHQASVIRRSPSAKFSPFVYSQNFSLNPFGLIPSFAKPYVHALP